MPQIDKVLFLPQVFGSFVFIFLTFIFLVQFAGLLLASTYKARNNLMYGFMGVSSKISKIMSFHLSNYGKLITLSLKVKSIFFFIICF